MPLTVSIHALRLAAFSLPLTLAATASQAQFGNVSDLPSSRYQASPPSPDKQPPLVDPHAPLDTEPQWDGDKPFNPDLHAPQFPAPPMPQEMLDGFKPAALTAFNVSDLNLQFAPVIHGDDETLVRVSIDGIERIVHLRPFTLRTDVTRLVVQVEGGLLLDQALPAPATYRGSIDGMPAFDVAASIRDGEVSMLMLSSDPAQPSWYLQPLRDGIEGLPHGIHTLYRADFALPDGHRCGVGEVDGFGPLDPAPPPNVPMPDDNGPIVPGRDSAAKPDAPGGDEGGIAGDDGSIAVANIRCQIGLDADFEFYQANGSSVINTIYDMELIMNQVGLIYQNQVEIAYTETILLVRTTAADPYFATNSATILCEFGDWWNANITTTRDVAHLFTGKDMDGNTVGLAWPGVVCNVNLNTNPPCNGGNKAYCIAQSRFSTVMANRVQDTAHELGHNWNACHCDQQACTGNTFPDGDCGIMNSIVSIGSTNFEVRGRNAIRAFRDSRPCLDVWQNPTYVNWSWGGAENGSISNPWNTIFEGLDACLVGGALNVQAGNYFQNPNIFKAKSIHALNGLVRIGN